MNIDAVIDELMGFAEDNWLGLWLICSDVEDELGAEDPAVIANLIRCEWVQRGGLPSWGDGPWFAHLRFCKPRHAAA